MAYMYRRRELRYSRLPPSAHTTLTRTTTAGPGGASEYGETDFGNTWDSSVQPNEFRNELFNELNQPPQPGKFQQSLKVFGSIENICLDVVTRPALLKFTPVQPQVILPDLVKQGEKENLLENDELNMQS